MIGIKIPNLAGNRIWAARLEGRDSTDHATVTDLLLLNNVNVNLLILLSVLAQMVASLPLAQRVWGLIPGGVVNFQPGG